MSEFMSVGDSGEPLIDWKAAAAAGAIGQIKEWKERIIDGGDGPSVINREFKLIDSQRALETVLKLFII